MVGRRGSRQKLMGNHQRCWLWGRHAVLETLRARRWQPMEIVLAEGRDEDEQREIAERAADWQIPVYEESSAKLTSLCRAEEHQGVIARMPPFPYLSLDEIIAPHAAGVPRFLVALDRIQDPYNFGAMLRSAEVFGADAVLVGSTAQAEVNSLVARSSVGAVNHVRLARNDSLPDGLKRLKQAGIIVAGAAAEGSKRVDQCDLNQPIVIVMGNEGVGLSPTVTAVCDFCVAIPQSGQVGSLNAAVAAGILLYEVHRQRHVADRSAIRT